MIYLNILILTIFLFSCNSEGKDEVAIDSNKFNSSIEKVVNAEVPKEEFDRYSYTLGHIYISESKKDSLFKLNPYYFILGALEAVDESEDYLSDTELNRLKMEFQQFMQNQDQKNKEKEQAEFMKRGDVYKEMHDDYIKQFKEQNPDAIVTESGVMYKVIRHGVGPFPKEKDFISFVSNGYFMDGKTFDTSLRDKQPKQFMLRDFFPGMYEVMEKLNKGARVVAVIPYDQAFGEQGSPPTFPPYSTLKFELEVLNITKLPEGSEALQGLPEGVKVKDIRTKRIEGPPQR